MGEKPRITLKLFLGGGDGQESRPGGEQRGLGSSWSVCAPWGSESGCMGRESPSCHWGRDRVPPWGHVPGLVCCGAEEPNCLPFGRDLLAVG